MIWRPFVYTDIKLRCFQEFILQIFFMNKFVIILDNDMFFWSTYTTVIEAVVITLMDLFVA